MLTVYAQRRRRLLSLSKGNQVVAMTAPNLFWLTGFFGAGAAVVHRDKTVVITTPLEADRANEAVREAEIVTAALKDIGKEVSKRLERGAAMVDDERVYGGPGRFRASPGTFLQARRTKDGLEIQRIRKACEGTDRVFEELVKELKPGKSEWELAAVATKAALEQRLVPYGPVIIASGPHGAYGHSELSDRRVQLGDFVVADLFFRYEGYYSDETRTFAVGTVSPEMKKHYAVVREAEQAALDAVGDGVPSAEVSEAAVRVLRRNKLDRFLNHSVGHGVGIDIHELPKVTEGNRAKLLRDDVITDEPGVYFVGKYGIRIEDTLRVDSKPDLLTRFTKDLVTCG